MVAESPACPSCREPIPMGRLSCPHCGTVLAAVARRAEPGSPQVVPAVTGVAERPIPDVLHSIEDAPALARSASLADDDAPLAFAAADGWDAEPGDSPEPAATWIPRPSDPAEVTAGTPADTEPDDPRPWPPAPGAWVPPRTEGAAPAPETAAVPTFMPARTPSPAPSATPSLASAAVAASPASPGGQPVTTALADPPPAPILARAWDPAAAAAGEGIAAAPAAAASRLPALALPRIDKAKIEAAADIILLAGAVGLAVSFVLPWFGSRGQSSYFDRWGLAGPGHIVMFLLVLGVLALAVLQNPIGRWLRTGVFGLVLGALGLGLLWPYLFSRLAAGPGAVVAFVAAVLLLVAGMISVLVLRHSALSPDV